MKDKIKNLIEILKKEKMTIAEKEAMSFRIHAFTKPAPTPYFSEFSFLYFSKVLGTLVIIVTIGITGLSYASASAVPGDPLYAIKTNLKEKIEDQFAFTPERKIALRQQRIEVRFSEVKTLIKEKNITPEKLSLVEAKIQKDKEKIGEEIEKINKENTEATATAKVDLETSIQENKNQIDSLIIESNTKDEAETDLEGESELVPLPKIEENVKNNTTSPETLPVVNPISPEETQPVKTTLPSTILEKIIPPVQ